MKLNKRNRIKLLSKVAFDPTGFDLGPKVELPELAPQQEMLPEAQTGTAVVADTQMVEAILAKATNEAVDEFIDSFLRELALANDPEGVKLGEYDTLLNKR